MNNPLDSHNLPETGGGVSSVLAAADKIAATTDAIKEIRALHHTITAHEGIQYCDHCCLNKIGQRRFPCRDNHTHTPNNAACPTTAILDSHNV